MSKIEIEKELAEQRALLKQCDDFIANYDSTKRELQDDVDESRKDLNKAKADLEEAKREYAAVMKKAAKEHYGQTQMKNLHNINNEGVRRAEEWVNECEGFLEKRLEFQRVFTPGMLAEAKADRPKIYTRVQQLENMLKKDDPNEKKYTWIGVVVIIVIIVLIIRACGN